MADHDPERGQLAEDRTDLAEDRTLFANERTFSGWARTAMASIGIGIGFHALFRPIEPTWVAKAIATLFFLLAVFLVKAARHDWEHSIAELTGPRWSITFRSLSDKGRRLGRSEPAV